MEDSRQGGSKYHRPSSSSTSSLPFSYLLSSSAPLGFCSLPFLRPGRWCRCFSLPLQHHLICLSLVLAAVLRISQEVSGNALANVKDSESLRLSFLNECPCLTCRPGRDYCGHTSILAVFPKSLAKKLTVEHLERELDQVLFENPQARPTSTLSSLRRAFSTVTRRIGERKQTRSPRPEGAPRVRIARWSHGIPQGRFSWLKPWRLVSRFAWRRRKQTSDIHLVPLRPSASLHDVLRVKPDLLVFPADVEEEVLRMRVTRFQELALDTEGLKTLPETCTSEGCFRTATLVALEGASTRPLLRKRRMIRCILGVGYGVPIRSILQVLERNAGTPFLPLRYGSPLSVSESESRASVGSPPSASWGGHNLSLEELGPDDLFLRTPDVLQLSLLFPSTFYFPVRLNEDFPAFNIDVEQMHIFPTSLSTYKCSSTQFRMFTPQGLADLQRALSAPYLVRGEGKMYKRMAAALAARRPGNIEREQDPTVVLHQWWRRENDEEEEIWTETPLQWAFPDLGEAVVTELAVAGIIPRWTEDLYRTSKAVRGFVSTSLSRLFIGRLQSHYNIDKEESFSLDDIRPEHSSAQFNSLQAFFTRGINLEVLRPWNPDALVVSPADAVLQNLFSIKPNEEGYIRRHVVPQVKSTSFHLKRFLFGDEKTPEEIKLKSSRHSLIVSIHYLSPRDYHRFHSPADWTITRQIYIPGCTPSVNRATLERREGILHHFERTSLLGAWDPLQKGENLFFSVSLVAARFVGGLSLVWEEKPLHPRGGTRACGRATTDGVQEKTLNLPMCAGQDLGAFRFGSTVVLIFEAPEGLDVTNLGECSHALVGQTLAVLPGHQRKLLSRCNAFFSNYMNPFDYLKALKKHPEFDDHLRQNSLIRRDWRSRYGRVRFEKIRAIERGLGTRYALARYLFLQWDPRQHVSSFLVNHPEALARAGEDRLGHHVPKCFPQKNKIRVEFQGRVSTFHVEISVKGEEALLFKAPFFGCVGDKKLGKDTRGISAQWRLSPSGEDIEVELHAEIGEFLQPISKLVVSSRSLTIKGQCETEWRILTTVSASTALCRAKEISHESKKTQELISLWNSEFLTTKLYSIPHPRRNLGGMGKESSR